MRSSTLAHALAALSLLLAVAALVFLVFWPDAYQSQTVTLAPDGEVVSVERTSSSLIEENGIGILWALVLPVGIAAGGLLAAARRSAVAAVLLWAAALGLTGFSFVSGLSVGPFYFPAAAALLIAALVHMRARRQPARD